jgi:RNA polymerase sigma-70 factor (ECF subfamily)
MALPSSKPGRQSEPRQGKPANGSPLANQEDGPGAHRDAVDGFLGKVADSGLSPQPNGEFRVTEGREADDGSEDVSPSDELSSDDLSNHDGVSDDMATLAINPDLVFDSAQAGASVAEISRTPGAFDGMEDAEIMLKLSAGDMAAFDFLLAKYRRPIIHFMYRMVHNEAVAEELAQEVFLRVYRSRETYRAEARFSTWLYRIATNLGVNHARDTRHERAASTIYLDEPDSESGSTPDVADMTPSAEANILRRERMAAIREHVMALPERQQMAVLMHKYEGMDYKQIGDVLKLSESATKSLLFRAYQTLREKLKPFI